VRAQLDRQLGRQRDKLPRWHGDVLRVRPGPGDPDVRRGRAPEGEPARADPALPAGAERRGGGRLPFPPPGHVLPEPRDPPAELVPEDLPVGGLPAGQRVHIGPAQPAGVDGDDNLVTGWGGIGGFRYLRLGPLTLNG
jgi:hypothetical protein